MKVCMRVFKDARKYWIYLIIGIVGVVVSTLASFYTPWAMRDLTELAFQAESDFALKALRIGLLLLGTTALQAVGTAVSGYLNHYAGLHYVADLRAALYGKLQRMSLQYFNKSRTGDLTGRVLNDAMQAEVIIAHVIPDIIVNLLTFAGVAVLLFTINVKLALISLVAIPFLLGITFWQARRLSPMWKSTSDVRGELSGAVQDNLSGIKEIQIFNQQKHEEERIAGLSLKHARTYLRASFFFESSYPMIAFFTALGSVAVIILGGRLVAANEVGIADIVGFVMYLGLFYGPVKSLSGIVELAGKAIASCRRVFEVMDEMPDVREAPNAKRLGRAKGAIEFRDLTFHYHPDIPMLKNITLSIKPGQTVGLVGTTGVGKSTLASLLNRFYDPVGGAVLIDGVDIKSATLGSLRDNISMVLQDTFLFNGTVYDNIVYGWRAADRSQVIAAAKAANAHDFIKELENGYDTVIGERGVRLSGGQKQRLSIARAMLRNSPILILDEATSALDTQTEKEIQAALDEVSRNRTTLVIAHRLSTVRHADLIVVLEGTGIAEIGSHEELVARGGIYANLYQAQVS